MVKQTRQDGLRQKYRGVVVPMVTPFTSHGDIDLDAAERIIDHIAGSSPPSAGGACLFALGTTGEAASISFSSKARFVDTVVKKSRHSSRRSGPERGRTIIYAGVSDNCLATSADMAKQFFDLGVDVVVAHVPSYYPLTSDDILGYYENLAERVPGPLMLYNIPMTTGVSVPLEVIDRLSYLQTIIGLKDSDNDLNRMKQAIALWKDREDFSYLCGCTALNMTALAMGADGIVPSVGNIVPDLFVRLYHAVLCGNLEQAERCQKRANDISDIFQKNKTLGQSLPILKAIMHVMGFCEPKVLPPLRDLTADQIRAIRETVDAMGLLQKGHPL